MMAWGYEKSFTIEHDNTLKKRIDCRDCSYYDIEDKSCIFRLTDTIYGEAADILN